MVVVVVVCVRVARAEDAATPKRDCSATLYAEPTFLVGVDGEGKGVQRIRGGLGFVAVGCSPTNAETYNLRLGGFLEGGSEQIGNAFSAGLEVEYSNVFDGRRLGVRAAVDPTVVRTFALGARVRGGPFVLGVEAIYSARGNGQGAAAAVLGSLGLSGRAGAIVTLGGLVLAGIVVASLTSS